MFVGCVRRAPLPDRGQLCVYFPIIRGCRQQRILTSRTVRTDGGTPKTRENNSSFLTAQEEEEEEVQGMRREGERLSTTERSLVDYNRTSSVQ